MNFFLRFLLFSMLVLSPCSIKASIQQIIQEENINIHKTSPNKSLSFKTSICEDLSQKTEVRFHDFANIAISPSLPKTFVFIFDHEKRSHKTIATSSKSGTTSQKLFILYSQLKIANT